MGRLAVVLTAVAAAVATAAVLVTSGSAQSPTPTTLHLVAKSQSKVGFEPRHRPRQGDRFGFGDLLSGDDHGTDRGVCTLVGKQGLCTVVARLSRGTLTVEGVLAERSRNAPLAITGGTGAYNGARGTALITDVNERTTNVTVNLLP
ncbi:MAG: hypothetical protein M3296_07020 [Actinomycetota bacterium]|nr:hypothetical protein [Actinomycetota bacterium]